MWMKFTLVTYIFCGIIFGCAKAQFVDNFVCPDEFEGYYPHLYSCDRYWKCIDAIATLETCGNGLAFDDTDPTFTTENCNPIYNVECGNRSELEPPISAPNCPRLYGTFADEDDCTAFFNCRNGLANRYNCAPGLAFDPSDRVCKWADQVDACKKMMNEEEKAQVFTCPKTVTRGVYSKHAHPQDCRQYFVCITGTAREYGCPLGSVFKITSNGQDGVCANPSDVPECANYYGDLEFQPEELVKAGVDPEVLGISARSQSGQRVANTFTEHVPFKDDNDFANFDYDEPTLVPAKIPAKVKPAPRPVPVKINTNRAQLPQVRNKPQSAPAPRPKPRPAPTPAPTKAPTTTTTTTRRTTTTTPVPAAIVTTETEDFTEAPEIISDKIVDIIDTVEEVDGDNPNRPQPAVVKAGEDYYYYYYYYDDDETLPDEEA